ncbi:MAG: TetR/AcrR family transcriptional regulator [Actinobacteria bacterium]|nr:TetR/AcrR family transcriptional regulator [Actinomycetota bacterium]
MATTPTEKQSNPVRRPRGRPRDPRVEGAVLGATRELLRERGYGGLTVAAVADMAGVGKGTIYLRWPDKDALVVGVLAAAWTPIDDPDTGSLRDDLLAIMTGSMRELNGREGRLLFEIIPELPRCDALRAYWNSEVARPWGSAVMACLARGVERGEMRADVDVMQAYQMLMSPLVTVGATDEKKITTKQVTTWVDIFLGGVAA